MTDIARHANGHRPSSDDAEVESLYPFLYADSSNLDAVLQEVRRSTVDKAKEIMALRRQVLAADGARFAECAQDMAERFAAGGRLLAFGNGGSAGPASTLFFTAGIPGSGSIEDHGLFGDITATPEPAVAWMFSAGLGLLAALRYRQQRHRA